MGIYQCYEPFTGYSATADRGDMGNLTIAAGATPAKTSEWLDISNWENKVISWEVDGADATPDISIVAHLSSQGAYELNQKTATTDDYVASTIAGHVTDDVYTRKDTTDFDDLQRPIRSIRFVITNLIAEAVAGVSIKIEGWS